MSGPGTATGIIGSGAFATALAGVIGGRGYPVVIHCDDDTTAKEINETHHNERRLPGVVLPPSVRASADLGEVTRASRLLVLAVPSPRVNESVRALGEVADGSHLLVHAIGAPTSDGMRRVSDLVREETCIKRVGAIAGPALAHDLAQKRPCAIICGSQFTDVIDAARAVIHDAQLLHVYRSHDLIGVELASALSGAMTIALGLADGVGLGAGPRAFLLCRAVAEATRLVLAAGGRERTFAGLAGLGNLLVRASPVSGERSDDYQLGLALARGAAPARRETEGARAAVAGQRLGQRSKVRTPVLDAVVAIVQQGVSVQQAAARLFESATSEEE